MKFLIDECLWKGVGGALSERGHDVAYVVLVSPGLADEDVLDWAEREDRVVLTHDRRMSTLVRYGEFVPRGIVVVDELLVYQTADLIAPLLNQLPGQITTIEPDKPPRMRPIGWLAVEP
ncbi:DUF5615 family PIN-like protein [Brevundimonas aurifodinae]|uniref:DUF5615 family PIN-like protein n=2 Tax=Brevundimonas TaxID=41275 RepID=A0ABV1NRQ7_9CAUL|nr:MAG: hypothetical protein B7Z42_07725 [Brevundimonas sp. 12-68-7]OYX33721.1 MAG: hypothetical protein B7Z01_08185 [Brevundimonas subvibrioides]